MTGDKIIKQTSPRKRQPGSSSAKVVSDKATSANATLASEQLVGMSRATRSQAKNREKEAKQATEARKTPERNNEEALSEDIHVAGAETHSSSSSPSMPPTTLPEPGLSTPPPLHKAEPLQNEPSSPVKDRVDTPLALYEYYAKPGFDPSKASERAKDWNDDISNKYLYISVHESHFPSVSSGVAILVANYFPWKCRWEQLDDDTKRKLTKICPQAMDFIEDPYWGGARSLFKAYIFRVLIERLFTAQDKWSTPAWGLFGAKISSVHGTFDRTSFFAHSFHQGVFEMARMLQVHEGPHVDATWLVNVLRDAMRPFDDILTHERGQSVNTDKHRSAVQKTLRELAHIAIFTDFAMISSPYRMEFEMLDPNTEAPYAFKFRDAEMKNYNGEHGAEYEGRTVEFIIEPLLKTYGSPRVTPVSPRELPQYFASVVGGYSDCIGVTKMVVFVKDST